MGNTRKDLKGRGYQAKRQRFLKEWDGPCHWCRRAKAVEIEPNYSKVHKRLGYTYEAMGKREEAMECFKKAMEIEEI